MIFLQYEHNIIQFVDSDGHFEWSGSWSAVLWCLGVVLVTMICSFARFVRSKRGRQGIFCIIMKRLRNIEYKFL